MFDALQSHLALDLNMFTKNLGEVGEEGEAAGDVGSTGAAGAEGLVGAAGVTGDVGGAEGPAGLVGLVMAGAGHVLGIRAIGSNHVADSMIPFPEK